MIAVFAGMLAFSCSQAVHMQANHSRTNPWDQAVLSNGSLQAGKDCYDLANSKRKDCSPGCKAVLTEMGEECRQNTLNGPDEAIRSTAKWVFEQCGVPAPKQSMLESMAMLSAIGVGSLILLAAIVATCGGGKAAKKRE